MVGIYFEWIFAWNHGIFAWNPGICCIPLSLSCLRASISYDEGASFNALMSIITIHDITWYEGDWYVWTYHSPENLVVGGSEGVLGCACAVRGCGWLYPRDDEVYQSASRMSIAWLESVTVDSVSIGMPGSFDGGTWKRKDHIFSSKPIWTDIAGNGKASLSSPRCCGFNSCIATLQGRYTRGLQGPEFLSWTKP